MISNIFVISVIFLVSQIHASPMVETTPVHGRTSEDLETIKIAMYSALTPEFSFLPVPDDLESKIQALNMYIENNPNCESRFNYLLRRLQEEAKDKTIATSKEKKAIPHTFDAIEKELKAFEETLKKTENFEKLVRKDGHDAVARCLLLSSAHVILTSYIAKLNGLKKALWANEISMEKYVFDHIDKAVQILKDLQKQLEFTRIVGKLNTYITISYEKREKECNGYFDKFKRTYVELELIKKVVAKTDG